MCVGVDVPEDGSLRSSCRRGWVISPILDHDTEEQAESGESGIDACDGEELLELDWLGGLSLSASADLDCLRHFVSMVWFVELLRLVVIKFGSDREMF